MYIFEIHESSKEIIYHLQIPLHLEISWGIKIS